MQNGEFFVVATPIGNLKDITLRALEVLKNVDFIACEDTRVTRKLLDKYDIKANLFDYQKFNEKDCSKKILDILNSGKSVALVSDAGTPGISDPGKVLFEVLRKNEVKINLVPGACAISTFLSGVSRDNEAFVFVGFLMKTSKAQAETFQKYKDTNLVFYESPNRLLSTLENIVEQRGADVKVAVGRELTKMYEEIKIGTAKEIFDYYSKNVLKGEIVAMVFADDIRDISEVELVDKIRKLKAEKYSDKDISRILSVLLDENKNKIYKLSLSL